MREISSRLGFRQGGREEIQYEDGEGDVRRTVERREDEGSRTECRD